MALDGLTLGRYARADTMKDRPLAIGVVIPTRNVQPALQAHLARLHAWTHLVEEIVVVDSHSTDGTLETLTRVALSTSGHRN